MNASLFPQLYSVFALFSSYQSMVCLCQFCLTFYLLGRVKSSFASRLFFSPKCFFFLLSKASGIGFLRDKFSPDKGELPPLFDFPLLFL